MHIDGYKNCKLETFIEKELSTVSEENIADLLIQLKSTREQNHQKLRKLPNLSAKIEFWQRKSESY